MGAEMNKDMENVFNRMAELGGSDERIGANTTPVINAPLLPKNTRPAEPVGGLETVARLGGINGVCLQYHIDGERPEYVAMTYGEELIKRSQAEAIIAALQSDVTGSASVIEHLTQRAERAEADNAALTALVKGLEKENNALEKQALRDRNLANETHSDATLWQFSVDMGDHPSLLVKVWKQRKALGTQLAAARKALEFYADVHKYPAPFTGGMGDLWSDCGAVARAALEAKP